MYREDNAFVNFRFPSARGLVWLVVCVDILYYLFSKHIMSIMTQLKGN